jgi:Bifunctional DNA primase/polymerase, N-terminal
VAGQTPAAELVEWLRLPVFPCLENKAPACPGGFKTATRDPAEIRELWRRYPGPLVGVATGAVAGFDVLDIDPKNGGRAWLEEHRGKLSPTRVHRTRSGGLHVLFRHHDGLRNSAGKIAPGVDVRADGGYVIWWPMERYQARGSLHNPAEWPLWILPALMERSVAPPPAAFSPPATDQRIVSQLAGLARVVAGAVEGQRNSTLFWAANRAADMAREGRIQPGAARDLLHSLGGRCGLPAFEVQRTVANAFRGSL